MQGVCVFVAGNLLQFQSHWILASLRRRLSGQEKKHGDYSIPRGGAFELVSCPHYLGEIIVYGGLMIMLGQQNLSVFIIFSWVVSSIFDKKNVMYSETFCCIMHTLFVTSCCSCSPSKLPYMFCNFDSAHPRTPQVANLLLAAGPTHRWYKGHFKQYPENRRALIPFLYWPNCQRGNCNFQSYLQWAMQFLERNPDPLNPINLTITAWRLIFAAHCACEWACFLPCMPIWAVPQHVLSPHDTAHECHMHCSQ